MIVTYEGRDYDIDDSFRAVTAEEWREIKRKLGLTVRGVLQGMIDVDTDAVSAVRWLTLRTADNSLVLDPAAEFSVMDFAAAWKAAEDARPEPEPDPTPAGSLPAGTTPESTGSSTPTSETSSPSTPSPSPVTAGYANGRPAVSPSPASPPM